MSFWHRVRSFLDKFVICSVSIESLLESLKVSPTILTHQVVVVVEYRINLTNGTFTLLKPTIYPDSHDLVQHSLLRLELAHSNWEGSRELPSHNLLPKIFNSNVCETFQKDTISHNYSTVLIMCRN